MAQTVAEPAASTASQSGPRLTISTDKVDFGEVDDSGPVHTTVTITNEGDEVLEIGNISVTCGCTAGEVGTKTLQPGESTELTVNFDARNRAGQQHGKRVTIDSNDPTGAKSIEVDVWVLPRVVVEPGIASFGQVVQGEAKTVILSVKGMTSDFEVLSASIDREDAFSVRLLEPKVSDREHPRTGETIEVGESLIEVHMSDQARVGRIDGGLRLETNDPNSPVKNIRVTAVVAGDIAAEPTRVSLAALTPGEKFEETFKLVSARGIPFQVKKATLVTSTMSTLDRDQIEVSYAPIPKPEDENEKAEVGYFVTVKGVATDSMRIIQGSIVVLTDAEGQRVVRTPITGVVRAQSAAADQNQGR
ncbi:MAG: DUF1573 domain-containing protein [Phycisphaerales bacterium]|nr:DUF1573 domain-containing protein [Phycisphaerales bacterium]MCB9835562.1 DUF1573 domain-containing protein [Phycisphaera sp.]